MGCARRSEAGLIGNVQNFDRPATAGLDLTIDTSDLTALANDDRYGYGYETRVLPAGGGPQQARRRPGGVVYFRTVEQKPAEDLCFWGFGQVL
jgi:hypothetical protein